MLGHPPPALRSYMRVRLRWIDDKRPVTQQRQLGGRLVVRSPSSAAIRGCYVEQWAAIFGGIDHCQRLAGTERRNSPALHQVVRASDRIRMPKLPKRRGFAVVTQPQIPLFFAAPLAPSPSDCSGRNCSRFACRLSSINDDLNDGFGVAGAGCDYPEDLISCAPVVEPTLDVEIVWHEVAGLFVICHSAALPELHGASWVEVRLG